MGTFTDAFLPAITGDLAQVGPAAIQGQMQGQKYARDLALLDMQIKQQQLQNQQMQQAMGKPQTPTFHNLGAGAFAIVDPITGQPTRVERPPQQQHFYQPVPATPGQPIFNPNTGKFITAPGQAQVKPPIPFEAGQPIFNPTTGQWGTTPGLTKPKATPGQTALDQAFGKDYAEWVAAGGYADTQKQLQQLRNASMQLSTNASLTGPFVGMLPDVMRNVTNPQAIAVRDSVNEVVQRNLRMILGPQFTQREGELLMARAFNPQQPAAENKKRIDRLIKQIEDAAKAKKEASEYFEQHGTLQGWKGKLPSIGDFNPDVPNPSEGSKPVVAANTKPIKAGASIRFNQLTQAGKTKQEAFQIMAQEGY